MKIEIRSCLVGAEKAQGVVVIIDVFRSSNTILMCLSRGAASVVPVASVDEAMALKASNPEGLLAGERKGITLPGFDLGNSPDEVSRASVAGKEVILTTSAGTQGIARATRATAVLIGSFGNAASLVRGLKDWDPPLVTLLPLGTEGVVRAVEDELCAFYLAELLDGRLADFELMRKTIMTGEGASRLKSLGQEADFPYCLALDIFDIVPAVHKAHGRVRITADPL